MLYTQSCYSTRSRTASPSRLSQCSTARKRIVSHCPIWGCKALKLSTLHSIESFPGWSQVRWEKPEGLVITEKEYRKVIPLLAQCVNSGSALSWNTTGAMLGVCMWRGGGGDYLSKSYSSHAHSARCSPDVSKDISYYC